MLLVGFGVDTQSDRMRQARREREITTREIAPNELDVDEPRVREVVACVPGPDDPGPDQLAVLVEIETVPILQGAILAADAVTRHTPEPVPPARHL